MEYLGIYEVESFFGALDQLLGSLSDIGAHQDLQKPKFVMPELMIKNYGAAIVSFDLAKDC